MKGARLLFKRIGDEVLIYATHGNELSPEPRVCTLLGVWDIKEHSTAAGSFFVEEKYFEEYEEIVFTPTPMGKNYWYQRFLRKKRT